MKKIAILFLIPIALISLGFLFIFLSIRPMSLTMDELAHIPAGFSYLYAKDFRLNPEHPPLVKDLSAIPLMFLNLNFPENHESWQTGVNNQWWFGNQFIFKSGNDADNLIFWARIPMIFLTVFFWLLAYLWSKNVVGPKYALIVLLLAVFSPTIIAHGGLVTTDIGAAFGFLLAVYFWIKFLKHPDFKNTIIFSIVFGFSLLLKFSLVLLIPIFGIVAFAYWWASSEKIKKILKTFFLATVSAFLAILFVVWPIYYIHTLNYPIERQVFDTKEILTSNPNIILKNATIFFAGKEITRPIAHYALGLLMATQRVGSGNTVYFLGDISATAWKHYFPVVYILKEPLSFYILALCLIFVFLFYWIKNNKKKKFCNECLVNAKKIIVNNIEAFSLAIILIVYWTTSILGNLNIGVRHILPVMVPTYILFVLLLKKIIEKKREAGKGKILIGFTTLMLIWYCLSSIFSFPHYLSYFNELVGGSQNGYKYVVDSNYDWGQDLKRLQKFVEDNNIEKIKIDYFGGDDVEYRLGDKWERFNAHSGPQKGWLAISATLLQGGRGNPTKGFDQPTDYYKWLNEYKPVARAGNSIFIYKID